MQLLVNALRYETVDEMPTFRVMLQRRLQILHHLFLSNKLLDLPLRFDIEWVVVKHSLQVTN